MKKSLLLFCLVWFLSPLYGQINTLYKAHIEILSDLPPDARFCRPDPNSYNILVRINSDETLWLASQLNRDYGENIWGLVEDVILYQFPQSFYYSDEYSRTDQAVTIPESGYTSGSVSFEACAFFHGYTDWSISVTPLNFTASTTASSTVCGNEPVTLTASIEPQTTYNWYVKNTNSGSWTLFRPGEGSTITITRSQLPGSLNFAQPIHFKATTTYGGYAVETIPTEPSTFYPAIPSIVSLPAQRPSCSGGTGTITINTTYTSSNGNIYAILRRDSDAPIDPPTPITSGSVTVNNLAPGNWKVKLQNAAGTCSDSSYAYINTAPPPLTVSASASPPLCSGGTGSITATAGGGTPPYQYSVNGGATYQSSDVFNGLSAGDYAITVKDGNNCTQTFGPVTISPPTAATLSFVSKTNPSGYGLSDGQIAVSVSGGNSASYTFSLDGGAYATNPSRTFTGLAAGSHTVVAQDANGCTSNTLTVLLDQPPPLSVTATGQQVSCNGYSDGTITATASGGTNSGYQYRLNSGAYQVSPSFSSLATGSYTIGAKDSNGNTATATVTITQPGALSYTASKTDVSCHSGSDGTVTLIASGGTPGYTYYVDGISQTSGTFTGISAGTHTLQITDSKGCSTSGSVTISEPSVLITTVQTKTDNTCNGASAGTVTLSATGGNGGYQYKLNSGSYQVSPVFSGLSVGTYTATVKDSKDCTATIGFTITEPPLLVLTEDLTQRQHISCHEATDGKIVVSSAGGTGAVQYTISSQAGNNTSGIFTGLAAGTHIITATDANNCSKTLSVTLTQPAPLSITATPQAVSCNGGSNGKLTITPAGGTAPYEYSINSGPYQSSNLFTGLIAGNYTIQVKDSHGCETNGTYPVTQPDNLLLSISGSNPVSCYGGSNGQIQAAATGGNAPYVFSINGGPLTNTTGRFENLPSGSYIIKVHDNKGCETTISTTISQPSQALSASISPTMPLCNGASNGEITVSASGGTFPYTYSINGGVFQSGNTFSGLPAGTHQVIVKDANGCTQTYSQLLTEPAALDFTATTNHVICYGDASGSITVTATGGTAPHQYNIDGGTWQIGNTFAHLVAGNYVITVKDAAGCETSHTQTINHQNAPLALSVTTNSPSVCRERGSISITSGTGGQAPYTYSLDNTHYTSGTQFDNLVAGNYQVFIKDVAGCVASVSTAINVPLTIQATVTPAMVSCYLGNDGSITLTNVTGANGNYLYSIDGTSYQSSPTFTGLSAGTYIIYIKDQPYSCESAYTVTLTQPSALNVSLMQKQDVSCKNGNDGSFIIGITGGTSPYAIRVNGAIVSTTNQENLLQGNYTVEVTDDKGCSKQLLVTITEPSLLVLDLVAKQDIDCFGEATGTIRVAATGGTPPYRYRLNSGTFVSTETFINLPAGNHQLTVKDANNCIQTLSVTLNQPEEALTLREIEKKNVSCIGENNGFIKFEARGGTAPYRYFVNRTESSTPTATDLYVGSYLLEVKDAHNCSAQLMAGIDQPQQLVVTLVVKQPVCYNECSGEISFNPQGGTPPYRYDWLTHPNMGNSPIVRQLCSGIYRVRITDDQGCFVEHRIELKNPQQIKIENVRDTVLCKGQQITFDAGNPGATYLWTADNGFLSTQRTVPVDKAGKYKVTVTNAAGCSASKEFSIVTSNTLLKADFLQSSVAAVGDTVLLVDVSKPTPAKAQWVLPAGAVEIGSNAEGTIKQVIYNSPGSYTTMMTASLGECADATQKTITIMPKGQTGQVNDALGYQEELIKVFKLYPNPTSGRFTVRIELSRKENIRLRMIDFARNHSIEQKDAVNNKTYDLEFNHPELVAGVYVIALEVAGEARLLKFIKL